jgi:hypothetical protein
MIGRLQKTKLLEKVIAQTMKGGRYPKVRDVIASILSSLKGKRFGAPFVGVRPAVPGQPIGGPRGNDIELMFGEMKEDLQLLFEALIDLAARNIDIYDIFSVRRDRLTLKLNQLRLETLTLLAQQAAGSRSSVTDSFNTLDNIDLTLGKTTARIDLDEGVVTLPPDSRNSIRYDGTRAKVVRTTVPPGGTEAGPPFQTVFDPYRLGAWYATLPIGQEYVAEVNVTGTDYDKGGTDEVTVNALRVEPTGPIHLEIDWSPDGKNWHRLDPAAQATIRDKHTFHFTPVNLGYLRFRIRHSEEIIASAAGQTRPVGLKRIEILQRGYNSFATLYSKEFRFTETIHTVVAEIDAQVPFGTRVQSYVSLTTDGPWQPLIGGPVTFDTRVWQDLTIKEVSEEQEDVPSTMWRVAVPEAQQPLPNTGEMIAGRGQIQISAYPFDWRQMGDRAHIPDPADWSRPLAEIRTRTFRPIAGIGTTDIVSGSFSSDRNPVAFDDSTGESFMTVAVLGGDGTFSLQPGYNYRIRTYAWATAPVTLENQRIGVVNLGGTAGTIIAPLALFVNGEKVFQRDIAATSIADLAGSQYQATIPLKQGYNDIQLLVQLPADLAAGSDGLAANSVHVYFQPNLFSPNLTDEMGIEYIQAYRDPWKRVSEFDLRYNIAPGHREAWAWDINLNDGQDQGKLQYVLLNHDPTNSAGRSTVHQSFQTIDGLNIGEPINLFVRYPSERLDSTEKRSLYFRADLFQDPGASSPPVLRGYRLIVN